MKHNLSRIFSAARKKSPLSIFSAATTNDALELVIYDDIGADYYGGVSAADIKSKLDGAGDVAKIVVRLNSAGGDVFEGAAIYNLLAQCGKPVDVYVDGLAASAAFTIAMAGTNIFVGEAAMMMLHNAWSIEMGDANVMRKMADLLDKVTGSFENIYVKRSGKDAADVKSMMDAETWLTAQDAVDNGFADEVVQLDSEKSANASALAKTFAARFAKTPAQFKADANDMNTDSACDCQCGPCLSGNHADCTEDPCPSDLCSCDNPKEDDSMDASAQAAAAQLAASFDRMKKRIQIAEL